MYIYPGHPPHILRFSNLLAAPVGSRSTKYHPWRALPRSSQPLTDCFALHFDQVLVMVSRFHRPWLIVRPPNKVSVLPPRFIRPQLCSGGALLDLGIHCCARTVLPVIAVSSTEPTDQRSAFLS